jgi:uncharacterized protein (TIGR01732 family)
MSYGGNNGFVLIVVLFILLIIVGASGYVNGFGGDSAVVFKANKAL